MINRTCAPYLVFLVHTQIKSNQIYLLKTGRLKTQVGLRKTKVPEDGICKYGKRKYESATVENVSTAT